MSFPFRLRPSHAWATLACALVAFAALTAPRLAEVVGYRREEIAAGQLWRLWSGHLVHFGWRHWLADTLVFLAAGLWLESFAPRTARAYLFLAPAALSAVLYFDGPPAGAFGGLSGLGVGLLVGLALVQIGRDRTSPRGLWVAVLAVVGVKIALETFSAVPLFAGIGADLKSASLVHLAGAACGLLAWPWARREAGPATPPPADALPSQ